MVFFEEIFVSGPIRRASWNCGSKSLDQINNFYGNLAIKYEILRLIVHVN